MTIALRLPAMLSILVLAAHFLRIGILPWVLLLLLLFPLMAVHRRWVMRVVQLVLLLGAAVWVKTLLDILGQRASQGLPWQRMAMILGSVAAVCVVAALLFELPPLRRLYAKGSAAATDVAPALPDQGSTER